MLHDLAGAGDPHGRRRFAPTESIPPHTHTQGASPRSNSQNEYRWLRHQGRGECECEQASEAHSGLQDQPRAISFDTKPSALAPNLCWSDTPGLEQRDTRQGQGHCPTPGPIRAPGHSSEPRSLPSAPCTRHPARHAVFLHHSPPRALTHAPVCSAPHSSADDGRQRL